MLTWMGLPFLQNRCIKIADRDFSSFHCMALDNSFLSQYYFLGWPLILILQGLQHWFMGYLGEDLIPSLNICHFILAASWVDTFVKGGLRKRRRREKCGITETYRKQWLSVPAWLLHAPQICTMVTRTQWKSYFLEDLRTSGLSISLALFIFLFPLPKTAPQVSSKPLLPLWCGLTLVLKSERCWPQFSGICGWRCNMRYPMGQRALSWD